MTSTSYDSDCDINWNGVITQNRYILIEKLGDGSFAVVWLAYDMNQKKLVAIKIHNVKDNKYGDREYNTYTKFKSLNIPHILHPIDKINIKNPDDDELHTSIIMDLMECSLYDLLKKTGKKGFPQSFVKSVIKQVLEFMNAIDNNNFAHNDIKPDNILLKGLSKKYEMLLTKLKSIKKQNDIKKFISAFSNIESDSDSELYLSDDMISINSISSIESSLEEEEYNFPENPKIFISDMGSCIELKENPKFTQTRYYMAPELILGLPCSSSADMWSLGCMFYELLTGKVLFNTDESAIMVNRNHLYQIISLLGDIPKEMKELSPYKDILFHSFGNLKGWDEIKERYMSTTPYNELLLQILTIDPNQRLTPQGALDLL